MRGQLNQQKSTQDQRDDPNMRTHVTATSLEESLLVLSYWSVLLGSYPRMVLIQMGELLRFIQIYVHR